MASINKLFLQKDRFGRVIVSLKTELLRWQKQLSGVFWKKKVYWKTSQSTQENTCTGVSFKQSWRPEAFNFTWKRIHCKCFVMNFAKFLKTPIQSKVCEGLLLNCYFWTATSELINSYETSKWLLYTYYHISCWIPRKFTPMLSLSPCILIRFWF